MKKILEKEWVKQFIKFGLIGGSNTIVSYIAYVITIFLVDNLFLANLMSYVWGTINSYIWNNLWVFKKKDDEKRNPWIVLGKLFIMYAGTGIVLNYFLLILWIDVLGIPKLIAPILNSAFGIPINFIVSKFWCFRDKKKEEGME